MTLFQIETGAVGESYVRAYAWAASDGEALILFERRNPGLSVLKITPLMEHTDFSFCTEASDCGWER
jgi:hypothetical protein